MRTVAYLLTAVLLVTAVGCNDSNKVDPLVQENKLLKQQNQDLSEQVKQLDAQKNTLLKRVSTLEGVPQGTDLENLCGLQSVELTKYTNFYDKDKDADGFKETLMVYVRPIDKTGDAVKAVGSVEIELWDLSRDPSQAKLAEWKVGPEQLRTLWYSTLMRTNYRLSFKRPESLKSLDKQLTVKMRFTDMLTGRVFEAQHVIKPQQ